MKQSELQPQERVKKVITSPSADSAAVSLSLMRRGKKAAFTLAETMIVIVVLGIIATLTIPALVNKQKESVAKTKVRKAMAAYESALNKMIIENDLKDNEPLTTWAGDAENNCANSTQYFKKVQGDGCIFKTSDGVWWNITDITRPVISFKEITAQNSEQITTNANNENDKTAFVLVGRFGTDGSLRVDDLAYETANSIEDASGNQSKVQVEKLYTLLGMKKSSSGDSNVSPFAACNGADTCVVNDITYTKVTLTNQEYCKQIYDRETDSYMNDYCSTSTAGDYYVAIVGMPDDFITLAQNEYNEDYYNAAKAYCGPNGQLATIAQLKSLQSQGKFSGPSYWWYWAFEEASPDNAYYVNGSGDISNYPKIGSSAGKVICIGQ